MFRHLVEACHLVHREPERSFGDAENDSSVALASFSEKESKPSDALRDLVDSAARVDVKHG